VTNRRDRQQGGDEDRYGGRNVSCHTVDFGS
jgi:hypothetical protein